MNKLELINYIKTLNYPFKIYNNNQSKHLFGVDEIFIINLKKENIKRKYIEVLFRKKKINYKLCIVDPVDESNYHKFVPNKEITRSEFGCLTSHLYVLYNAYKFNINFIILEDDVWIHKNFVNLWNEFKIKNNSIDFALLGACDFNFKNENIKHINDKKAYVPNNFKLLYGAHGNYYSHNAAKFWLLYKINNLEFFDKNYQYIFQKFKGTSVVCSPNLAICDISSSNNNHEYSFFSEKEMFYYDKCFNSLNFNKYHIFYSKLVSDLKKNLKLTLNHSYEKLIDEILYVTFYNKDKETQIKNRIDFSILSLSDIEYILQLNRTI